MIVKHIICEMSYKYNVYRFWIKICRPTHLYDCLKFDMMILRIPHKQTVILKSMVEPTHCI